MKKFYIAILLISLLQGGSAQVAPQCRSNIEVYADKDVCGATLGEIQKLQEALRFVGKKFILEGATVGSGTGTINYKFFNIGRTKVTYPDENCIFFVTVLGDKKLFPDKTTLPRLKICLGAPVSQPTGRYSCDKDETVGAYLKDSSVLYKPGKDIILSWLYGNRQNPDGEQRQLIDIAEVNWKYAVDTLPTITGECFVTPVRPPVMINDCNSSVIVGKAINEVDFTQPGTKEITWDFGSHFKSQKQKVIIVERKGIRKVRENIDTIVQGCSIQLQPPLALVGCEGKERVIRAISFDSTTLVKYGEHQIKWTFTHNGETADQIQKVFIQGKPLSAAKQSLDTSIAGCSYEVKVFPKAVTCRGQVIEGRPLSPLKLMQPGEHKIKWVYAVGQDTIYQEQVINLTGNQQLTFSRPTLPDVVGNCSASISEIPTATYGCNNLKINGKSDQPLTYDKPGVYIVTWNYTVDRTNISQQQRVEVKDAGRLVPSVAALPTITGSCSVTLSSVPTAINSCSGKTVNAKASQTTFDAPGTYTVTWTFADNETEPVTQTQLVVVTSAGQLTPLKNVLPLLSGDCQVKVDEIPQAQDPCNKKIIQASTTDRLIYDQPGDYTITWVYILNGQTILTQTQAVKIAGSQRIKPERSALPPIVGNCFTAVTETPTARNGCTGAVIKATTSDPLLYNLPGEYIVHWTFQDQAYHFAQEQTVIVKGSEQLVFDRERLPDVVASCMVSIKTIPVARNPCSRQLIRGRTNDPLAYSRPGEYTINWTFKDGSIETTRQQRVIVNDLPEKLKIYPNPTQTEFRIMAVGCNLPEKIGIKVFDITGRLLDVKSIDPNREVLFGSAYQSGSYLLHVTQGGKTSVHKIIKAK